MAGFLLSVAILDVLVFVFNLLGQVDLVQPSGNYELIGNGVLALLVSLPQYVVLRFVLGYRTSAAKAWIPFTVLVFVLGDFVALWWLQGAPTFVNLIFILLFAVVFVVGQGLLLGDMLGLRSAPGFWLLGTVVFVAAGYLEPYPSRALEQENYVLYEVVTTVIVGATYGAVYGAFLVLMVKVGVRRAQPAPVPQGESAATI